MFHGKPIRAQAWQAWYSPGSRGGLGRPDAGHRLPRRGQWRRYPVDPYASRAAVRGTLGSRVTCDQEGPERPRRTLRGWGRMQQGCRRRTTAGGAAGPGGIPGVRACVACRRRPGPGWSGRHARRARMRRMPAPVRAERAQGGTSPLGIDHHLEDYGRMDQGPQGWRRRTWLAGASSRRVMIRRDRQWARTRRDLTPHNSNMSFAGFKPSNGV